MIIVEHWLERARVYDLLELKALADICRRQARERLENCLARIESTALDAAGGEGEG